jgi:hypothetical protein
MIPPKRVSGWLRRSHHRFRLRQSISVFCSRTRPATATLEPSALQDLVEVLPDLLKIAAGVPLQLRLAVTLGDGQEIGPS